MSEEGDRKIERLTTDVYKELAKDMGKEKVVSLFGDEAEKRLNDKPKGKFRCPCCRKVWDGSELFLDTNIVGGRWTCGDLTCGCLVQQIEEVDEQDEGVISGLFYLPGAAKFSQYLRDKMIGILGIKGPEIVDRSYNGEYGKEWRVYLNDIVVGRYHTFGPKPGESEFGRQYKGRISGYENEAVVVGNKFRNEENKIPIDSVVLIFYNRKFEAQLWQEGHSYGTTGRLIDTPWQRQDGHRGIPFP